MIPSGPVAHRILAAVELGSARLAHRRGQIGTVKSEAAGGERIDVGREFVGGQCSVDHAPRLGRLGVDVDAAEEGSGDCDFGFKAGLRKSFGSVAIGQPPKA